MSAHLGAAATAHLVRSGKRSARSFAEEAIAAAKGAGRELLAVTQVLEARALAQADRVDALVAAGGDPGPLAGVPFGVKDLFDVAGLPTTAGAGMLRDAPPATADAEAIARFEAAGAVLVATLNMDEFAYGFATINAAFGTTRNPHDRARIAGGSSGGSAAAVAAGLVPLSLGSDTNGSIRVPAALCGIWGMKPTHGGLPMQGVYPFVDSFDDIGPFATSVADLELAWRALGGQAGPAREAPRVARLGGWFARNICAELAAGIDGIAAALGGIDTVELPDVAAARSAAFLMTAAEGGARHLPELRRRAMAFDPQVRDRLIAGAMLPASAYFAAQDFRARFRHAAEALFERYDVLIAPAAGEVAPRIDDPMITVDGQRVPARAHLGIFTQPLSFIGLPVIAAPLRRAEGLPLGVQLVARPGGEATLFALAATLEARGVFGLHG
ncbi:AtzE family amidohydrolase [Sphingomonas sp. HITSZ_GF]|uniref:AtzE family amidohydrolase n=1 Tax=Sphingomonas sp. HITSZ_GF TaxID=3037247 RepID=UPI00240E65D6|nr:AtzE family amidohydrolase [Sphingomonas sp. HITSZ_GF]MDG2533046.1 AtzE family amidohydrolase [Sphingomonas sp. HITSZ_GF]